MNSTRNDDNSNNDDSISLPPPRMGVWAQRGRRKADVRRRLARTRRADDTLNRYRMVSSGVDRGRQWRIKVCSDQLYMFSSGR